MTKPKRALFDIETLPMICLSWDEWGNKPIAKKLTDFRIASFAMRDYDSGKLIAKSLIDYRGSLTDAPFNIDDSGITKDIWNIYDEYDIMIAHNGVRFDARRCKSAFLRHHLKPPSQYKVVDPYLVLKSQFGFASNSQDEIARETGGRRKLDSGGMDRFWACMSPDKKIHVPAYKELSKYNKGDLNGLDDNYTTLLPYITNHPNFNVYAGTFGNCPNCGSEHVTRKGFETTTTGVYQSYQCQKCGRRPRGEKIVRRKGTILK